MSKVEPRQGRSLAGKLSFSGGFVDEEADLAGLEREVNKAVLLMHRVAAEGLAEEDVPRRGPLGVHVFFDNSRDLQRSAMSGTYLDAGRLEFVLVHGLFGDGDRILKNIIGHVSRP